MEIVQTPKDVRLADWTELLHKSPNSLLFQSKQWVGLLSEYLAGVRDETLLCLDQGKTIGALPMLAAHGPLGPVANSLPFYGSNAAFIIDPDHPNPDAIREALWAAWLEREKEIGAAVTVLIDTPFGDHGSFLEKFSWDYKEERIGHLTPLADVGGGEEAEGRLYQLIHGKTRNMVKKAKKLGVTVDVTTDEADYRFLQETHEENLKAMGSSPKERPFFDKARALLDTRTYIGRLSGEAVAGLFLVRYHKTIEYFTPAIKKEFRSSQPLSAIIFQAMLDAAAENFAWWNWGASWPSQENLQLFKKRWGSVNTTYSYYIRSSIPLEDFRRLGVEGLLRGYPYFYVIPFRALDEKH